MSKQRRIKKLVKGHLNKFEANGEATYNDGVTLTEVSPSAQQSALESLNLLNDSNLATALGITNAGNPLLEAIDIDADGASHKDDFAPFDARELVDTDGDGIGDNRDILLTKLALDEIYYEKFEGAAGPETGTLYDAISTQVSVEDSIQSVELLAEGARNAALLVLQGADDIYTSEGLASLQTTIDSLQSSAVALQTQIAAMSATAGVTIADEPTYSDYNGAGGSGTAQADAALTDVVAPGNAASDAVDSMEAAVLSIEEL